MALFVFLFLLLVPLPCSAGEENVLTERYNVSYLDLSSGLPHNNISDIFEDSSGFLWISTFGGGLVRYDGYGVMEPRLDLNSSLAGASRRMISVGCGWRSTRVSISST